MLYRFRGGYIFFTIKNNEMSESTKMDLFSKATYIVTASKKDSDTPITMATSVIEVFNMMVASFNSIPTEEA